MELCEWRLGMEILGEAPPNFCRSHLLGDLVCCMWTLLGTCHRVLLTWLLQFSCVLPVCSVCTLTVPGYRALKSDCLTQLAV